MPTVFTKYLKRYFTEKGMQMSSKHERVFKLSHNERKTNWSDEMLFFPYQVGQD